MGLSHTETLMLEHGLTVADIGLPSGNVGVFGSTGAGKSAIFYGSRFVQDVIIADTGSMSHRLYSPSASFYIISPEGEHQIVKPGKQYKSIKMSPIDMVREVVEECKAAGRLHLTDSWSTLQEHEVAYTKKIGGKRQMSIPMHGEVVGRLRDLALFLAASPGFTIFNTSPGGEGKTPTGEVVRYPKGCITGYPSLNGTEAGKETILARWSSVWGVFKGHGDIPRGLYSPVHDIRPADMQNYCPLKDPYLIIKDTSENEKHIMKTFDLRDPANAGRCFIDEILILIAKRYKDIMGPRQQPRAAQPAQHEEGKHQQAQQSTKEPPKDDGKKPSGLATGGK